MVLTGYIILLDKERNELRSVEASEFEKEEKMRELIKDHPEVLSIPSADGVISLVEEYPVRMGAADLIAVDRNSNISVVEA